MKSENSLANLNLGRKKGPKKAPKRRKALTLEKIFGMFDKDPLELLMLVANGDYKALGYENECYFTEKADGSVKMGYVLTPELRADAMKAAVKYRHAQKQAVTIGNEGGNAFRLIIEDYCKESKKK